MIRSILLLGVVGPLLGSGASQPPQQGQLDASPTLFTVLAAINAAGYDADLDSNANSPIRKQVRDIDRVQAFGVGGTTLKKFFAAHRQAKSDRRVESVHLLRAHARWAAGFSVPHETARKFRWMCGPLAGLDHLIAEFYREANIEDLWKRVPAGLRQVIAAYHSGITKALLEANAYVRNPTSGYRGRRFQIYVDLLGAPNQIQTRSYKDDYFVVVTPSPEPQVDQIRHAYLHYLLDPLALRYFEQLNRLKGLADFAAPAPALDNAYKDDFVLLGH